jgi:protein-disulfide isomerase
VQLRIGLICLVTTVGLFAQTPAPSTEAWKTAETLPNADFTGLTAVQKHAVLKILRDQDCSCQCGMKTAECLMKDPNCSYSKALTGIAIKGVKEGKTPLEISKLMDASPKAHRPKVLEDAVQVRVAGSPSRGPENARITMVEFSDFECPYCSLAAKQVNAIMAAYPKDLKVIYKQYPLSMHPNAPLAAAASLAANEQGKFWPMHDLLFANYRKLRRENILAWAQEIGLDMTRFQADLDSPKYKAVVQKDLADGEGLGIYGTPAFFINGKRYNGPFEIELLKPILDAELKPKPGASAQVR